ncbi:MAG: T9SS type A sorting domain-containing protein [Candidatus Lokiarchaeota archaeon]|nr:T9SS type A sorting domain-containing protein [Candidatus Lokiarchaeota archaeon]
MNKSGESKPDGVVDMMIFINIADNKWHSNPNLCLLQHPCYYITRDKANGYEVKIHTSNGTTQDYQPELDRQVGIIAHEYAHTFGLYDLYDQTYFSTNAASVEYSAGIGYWGLMGEGYGMWGLYSLCEFSKIKMGWITPNKITSYTLNLQVQPGTAYKIQPSTFPDDEYFLISYRDHSNFYDRKLPAGLLVWHIDESLRNNTNEFHKFVDLECADGLYSEAGQPDPISGGDNLDYWAKFDSTYTNQHNGNKYDDTDPFDGDRHTAFTPYTNPNSNGYGPSDRNKQGNVSKLAIHNIRPGGICDVIFNFWKGDLKADTVWKVVQSPYYLGGNVNVPAGVALIIEPGTVIEYNGYSIISTGGTIIRGDVVTSTTRNQNVPVCYILFQNYPNPFNPTTMIQYELIQPADVLLKIYNAAGQEVRTLIDQPQRAGANSVKWDGTDNGGVRVSSGVYLCKMETAAGYQTIKMLLLR